MRNRPRYVLDTSVVVSAVLFSRGKPAQAFFRAVDTGEILVSSEVVQEYNRVLCLEKFERYVSEEERPRFCRACFGKPEWYR